MRFKVLKINEELKMVEWKNIIFVIGFSEESEDTIFEDILVDYFFIIFKVFILIPVS